MPSGPRTGVEGSLINQCLAIPFLNFHANAHSIQHEASDDEKKDPSWESAGERVLNISGYFRSEDVFRAVD